MMMRLSHPVLEAMVTLILLACHRCQLSDCAKPSSSSSPPTMEKAAVFPSAHRHDAELGVAHLPGMETIMVGDVVGSSRANDAAAGRAAPSWDATSYLQGKDEEGVDGSRPWQRQRIGAPRTALLLSSRLPRRFLADAVEAGAQSGTDGAGPSCHSHDVHVNCPPPSKH